MPSRRLALAFVAVLGAILAVVLVSQSARVPLRTPLVPRTARGEPTTIALARATDEEKASQLRRVRDFQADHREQAEAALQALKDAATSGENVFAVLMDAARVCSLQQITEAFFQVGGQYRRNV